MEYFLGSSTHKAMQSFVPDPFPMTPFINFNIFQLFVALSEEFISSELLKFCQCLS